MDSIKLEVAVCNFKETIKKIDVEVDVSIENKWKTQKAIGTRKARNNRMKKDKRIVLIYNVHCYQ